MSIVKPHVTHTPDVSKKNPGCNKSFQPRLAYRVQRKPFRMTFYSCPLHTGEVSRLGNLKKASTGLESSTKVADVEEVGETKEVF